VHRRVAQPPQVVLADRLDAHGRAPDGAPDRPCVAEPEEELGEPRNLKEEHVPAARELARTTPHIWRSYACCGEAATPLKLSLITASIALVVSVIIGTPVAYWLAHYTFRGKSVVDTVIDLPLVLPPSAAGFALLLLFGSQGVGSWLLQHGLRISLTPLAVVMAQVFIASPFYVKQARAGFEAVPAELRLASATLGAGPARTFFRVTAPLASHALLAGAVMAWARALGEFGATLVFAGAFPGRTETMPIAIYTASTTNLPASIALATTLVVVSFAVLLVARALLERRVRPLAGG
jgi:molybdate transport system permease protein